MLDPPARYPRTANLHFALVGHHFALEVAGKLASEEAHHVARAEVARAVLAQPGHQLLEVCTLAKQDVGRVLGLGGYPVVLHPGGEHSSAEAED